MNDPIKDMLQRASELGTPPEGYWNDYSQRLRDRLEGSAEPVRSSRVWLWWLVLPATAAASAIAAFALRWEAAAPVVKPVAAPQIVAAPQPRNAGPAPVVAEVAPSPAAEVASSPAPEIASSPAPEPTRQGPQRIAIAAKPIVTDVAPAPQQDADLPSFDFISGSAVQSAVAPPALRLTDYRLLRNGVEIARGSEVAAAPGGVVWFVDERGQRFAISAMPHDGFEAAGSVRGELLTFDWKTDRYHWVSAAPITTSETTLYVRSDSVIGGIERLPQQHDPKKRFRRPLSDRYPFVPRIGRLPLPPRGSRERGPVLYRADDDPAARAAAEDPHTTPVRVGSAASLAELYSPKP